MSCVMPIAATGRAISQEIESISLATNIKKGHVINGYIDFNDIVAKVGCTSRLIKAELIFTGASELFQYSNVYGYYTMFLFKDNSVSITTNSQLDFSTIKNSLLGKIVFNSLTKLDGANNIYYLDEDVDLTLLTTTTSSTIKALIVDHYGNPYGSNNTTLDIKLTVQHD